MLSLKKLSSVILATSAIALGASTVMGARLPADGIITAAVDKWEAPKFCHGIECPEFKTLEKTKGYEERQYFSKDWTSTTITDLDLDKATSTGFMRLFHYIQGENESSQKIDMTAPVITKIQPGQGPVCAQNFTMSFYVPGAWQGKAPKPSSSDVFSQTLPAMTVYVKSFGGFMKEKTVVDKAAELAADLTKAGITDFHEDFYFSAGYDSPFHIVNRHNEIWFVKKD